MTMGPVSAWQRGVTNQYKAAISGSMCYTVVGAATAWPSPTLIKMQEKETPLILDTIQVSWMVSLMFLGHISSPLPTGYLMDRFGLKRTCLVLSILPFTSWILIFLGDTEVYLYAARYLAGLWIGISSTIMPLYVGDIAETKLRTSLTTINNLLFNFGILFAYVVGPYVSYYMLAVACECLTVIFFCSFLTMPESPHYLAKRGERERALKALSWLRNGDPKETIEEELNSLEHGIEELKNQKGNLKDIFVDRGNRKAFIISISYSVLKRLSGSNVMQAYISVTLPKVTMGVLDPDTCVIIIGFVSFLSSIASTGLAIRYRRRTLLTISCAGCAISMAAIMVWFFLHSKTSVPVDRFSDVVFWSFVIYYATFNVALGPIGTSIKGEIFSAKVKGLSSSLTTLTVALMSFLLNKYYLIIALWLGMYVNYLIYSVSCVVAIVFTWTYVPELHKKTLEEIRDIMKGNHKR